MFVYFSKVNSILSAGFLVLLVVGCLLYFFENLSMELEVEALELANPGQQFYYQNGMMHTAFQTMECNVFHLPPYQPIDAAVIYNQTIYRKIREKKRSTGLAPQSDDNQNLLFNILSKIEWVIGSNGRELVADGFDALERPHS